MFFKNITMIDPKIQAKEKMNIGIEEDNIVFLTFLLTKKSAICVANVRIVDTAFDP